MSLKFHWFLPTNGGDGRHVVSGGHGVDAGTAERRGLWSNPAASTYTPSVPFGARAAAS